MSIIGGFILVFVFIYGVLIYLNWVKKDIELCVGFF